MTPEIYLNSFNYRKYNYETALRRAKAYGYDGVELWSGHFKLDTLEQDLEHAKRLGDQIGIPTRVLNLSGNVIGDDDAEREARTRRILEIIPRCADYGMTIINGYAGSLIVDRADWGNNGSAVATPAHYDRATAAYQRFGRAAQEAGVTITLEVHMNTIHDTAKAAVMLLDRIGSPAVKANLDPGNMWGVRTAEPPAEAIRILGDRIAYVHFKNARHVSYIPVGVDYDFTLSGGEIDYYAVVRDLVASGFEGPYGIEWSGSGDPSIPSNQDIAYLRSLLRDVATYESAGAPTGPAGKNEEPL